MYENLTLDDEIRITGQAIERVGFDYKIEEEGNAMVIKVFGDDNKLLTSVRLWVDSDGIHNFNFGGPGSLQKMPASDPRWAEIERLEDMILGAWAAESKRVNIRHEFFGVDGGQVGMMETAKIQTKKPGRPPVSRYDEAFQMIQDGDGTEEAQIEAFKWYIEEEKIKDVTKSVRDAFRSAMRYREKKRK